MKIPPKTGRRAARRLGESIVAEGGNGSSFREHLCHERRNNFLLATLDI